MRDRDGDIGYAFRICSANRWLGRVGHLERRADMELEMLAVRKELRKALEEPASAEENAALVRRCHGLYRSLLEKQRSEMDTAILARSCSKSPLEMSFLWMGGWRPTVAVILVYSLMGMQIETDLTKLLDGIDVPSMAALSGRQLQELNALQLQNRVAEDDLSHRLAVLQMSMADEDMVKATAAEPPPSESADISSIREAMRPKLSLLRRILMEAEALRSRTVEELFNILTPLQSVQFIVAALDLVVAVRKLGSASAQQPGLLTGSSIDGTAGDVLNSSSSAL